MTPDEASVIIARINAVWDRYPIPPEAVAPWDDFLAAEDFAVVAEAVDRLSTTETFRPSIADVINTAAGIRRKRAVDERRALAAADRATTTTPSVPPREAIALIREGLAVASEYGRASSEFAAWQHDTLARVAPPGWADRSHPGCPSCASSTGPEPTGDRRWPWVCRDCSLAFGERP